jgi:uncharacterized protein YidB (DUF937 family)
MTHERKEHEMDGSAKRKAAVGAAAVLALAGGGAAVAATQLTPKAESDAVVNDAAKQLGVSASDLKSALTKALEDRLDAAVKDGRLTQAQADELKQRLESGDVPLLGGPLGGHHMMGFPHLGAAATYLGVSESDLQTQLGDGKTLADVAKAKGKTVDGLVAALVADEKKELDQAVADGKLMQAQADDMLAGAKDRFTAMVNGERPEGGPGGHGFFGGPGGPPPGADSGSSDSGTGTAFSGPAA